MTKQTIHAAINGQGQYSLRCYFFKESQYVRYDWNTETTDSGYPQPLSAWNFPPYFTKGIDAALNGSGAYTGKAYFFKGSQYVRYDWMNDAPDPGYPQSLSTWGFDGAFATGIDCALEGHGPYSGKAYFFKGSQYIRYDWVADKLDDGYPQPLGEWNLPEDFAHGIDAAINGVGQYVGKAYLFRGNRYLRYDWSTDSVDPGYPQEISGGWSGLIEALGSTSNPGPAGGVFSFDLRSGESISERIVRCCDEALAAGPMGQYQRHDFYRDFISCRQEQTSTQAEALSSLRTSCAMFVRAVRHWCGASPSGPYVPGTGMFVSMGKVGFNHPAFVPNDGVQTPTPGDYFYISSTRTSNDGHTGIFVEQLGPNDWRTAEGGGGDGTTCQFTTRQIVGSKFKNDARLLWGWFDCTKVGIPESP